MMSKNQFTGTATQPQHNHKLCQFNPFSVGTATGWIQASRCVTRRLAWDPTCLPLSLSLLIKIKQKLQVLKSRRQYNLFLEKYPAFKELTLWMWVFSKKRLYCRLLFKYNLFLENYPAFSLVKRAPLLYVTGGGLVPQVSVARLS